MQIEAFRQMGFFPALFAGNSDMLGDETGRR
jgi:hypothetical protein